MRRALGAGLGALVVLWASLASAQAAGAFQLTWAHQQDPATLATGFRLRRCVQSGTLCTMADLAGATAIPYTQLSFTDLTIQANVTYCYEGWVVNQFGQTGPSAQICGKLGAPPKNPMTGLQLNIVNTP
jgi:hypothetical protein